MNVIKHKWTKQEENILSEGVRQYGCNWRMIRDEFFPELSPLSLKNKYYNYVRTFVQTPSNKSQPQSSTKKVKSVDTDVVDQIRIMLGFQ